MSLTLEMEREMPDGELIVEQVPALWATCRTTGCGNHDIAVLIPEEYGDVVICGVCRKQIMDLDK